MFIVTQKGLNKAIAKVLEGKIDIIPEKEKRKVPRSKIISIEAKDCLENMAEGLENQDLREALLRLAKRHKQR